ncbi:MAG: nascent polypeptide-associated complex protein [archaeon]
MAHKALKMARRMPGGRDAARMMQKMGMQLGEIQGVTEVVISTETKRIVIESPSVATINMQGQQIYQIAGGQVREEPVAISKQVAEEDAKLVSEQAMVTIEEARNAILKTEGDLAQAIILLKERRV